MLKTKIKSGGGLGRERGVSSGERTVMVGRMSEIREDFMKRRFEKDSEGRVAVLLIEKKEEARGRASIVEFEKYQVVFALVVE